MNNQTGTLVQAAGRSSSSRCWLCHIRDSLTSLRLRHLHAASDAAQRRGMAAADSGDTAPSPRDFYNGELEAAVLAPAVIDAPLRHDNPAELARARWLFALAWLIPILVISAALWLFPSAFDRAMTSLLDFSRIASSVPLIGSMLGAGWRTFGRRVS